MDSAKVTIEILRRMFRVRNVGDPSLYVQLINIHIPAELVCANLK